MTGGRYSEIIYAVKVQLRTSNDGRYRQAADSSSLIVLNNTIQQSLAMPFFMFQGIGIVMDHTVRGEG